MPAESLGEISSPYGMPFRTIRLFMSSFTPRRGFVLRICAPAGQMLFLTSLKVKSLLGLRSFVLGSGGSFTGDSRMGVPARHYQATSQLQERRMSKKSDDSPFFHRPINLAPHCAALSQPAALMLSLQNLSNILTSCSSLRKTRKLPSFIQELSFTGSGTMIMSRGVVIAGSALMVSGLSIVSSKGCEIPSSKPKLNGTSLVSSPAGQQSGVSYCSRPLRLSSLGLT